MPWQVPITIDGLEYPVTFNTEAEPTQDDLNEAVQSILQQRNQAIPQPTGETPGYLSQLGTALDIGYRQMASGVGATFNALTGDTADVASEMVEQAKLQREQQAAQTPEDVQFMQSLGEAEKAYEEASGPFETIGALAQYPAAVMSQPGAAFKTAVQSAPNVLVSGATQLAGRAIGGVLGGVAGIETGPGAILTGLAGYVAGGALSNTLMEAGPAIYDVLYERTQGAASNMTADQIAAYLKENPDVIDEGLKTGAVRGTVIGAVESIGMKGAGRLLTMPERAAARAVQKKLVDAGVDIASKAAVDKALLDPALRTAARTAADAAKSQFSSAGNLARLAGASAIETGASGVGELAAQAAAGQEVSTKEAFLEMLGEVALSAPMAAATKTIEGAKYILNPALQNPDTQESAKAANVVIDASASQMAADIEANRPSLVQAELDRIEKDRAERQAQDEASFQAIRKRREAQALQQLGIPAEQPAPAPTPITPAPAPEPKPLAELPTPSPLTGQAAAPAVGTATPTTPIQDATIQREIPKDGQQERVQTDEGRSSAETGGGYSPVVGGQVEAQEEVDRSVALPPPPEGVDSDIIDYILGNWSIESVGKKQRDKRRTTGEVEAFERLSQELLFPARNILFSPDRGRNLNRGNLDVIAQAAFERNLIPSPDANALTDEILKAYNARKSGKSPFAEMRQQEEAAEQRTLEFEKAARERTAPLTLMPARDLEIGDVVQVGDDNMRVTFEYDEDGYPTATILTGPKFGEQRVDPNKPFKAEKLDKTNRVQATSEFVSEAELEGAIPEPPPAEVSLQAPQPSPNLPAPVIRDATKAEQISKFLSDLRFYGTAKMGGDQYTIKQASDDSFYIEKTTGGQRSTVASGFSDIEGAQQGVAELVSPIPEETAATGQPTPAIEEALPERGASVETIASGGGMSIEEARQFLASRSDSGEPLIFGRPFSEISGMQQQERPRVLRSADKLRAVKQIVGDINKFKIPVSQEAVDTYGITLPEGYVKQGELYVFQPTAAETQTSGVATERETDEERFQRIKNISPSQRTDEDIAFANAFSKRQKELKPQAGETTRKAFISSHTASIGGRLRKALDQGMNFRGLKGTVGSWVETLYNEGWRMALDARGNRQFTNGKEALGSSGLGKVGMNYADFLSSQPQTTQAAAETQTPDSVAVEPEAPAAQPPAAEPVTAQPPVKAAKPAKGSLAVSKLIPKSLTKSKIQPNHVIVGLVSFPDYREMGVEQIPYDGTAEDAQRVAGIVRQQIQREGISSSATIILASDENGKFKWVSSPNGKIDDINTPEGQYALGDVNAFTKARGKKAAEARAAGDTAKADAVIVEQIDAEIGRYDGPMDTRALDEVIEARALKSIGQSVKMVDDRMSSWDELIVQRKRNQQWSSNNAKNAIEKAITLLDAISDPAVRESQLQRINGIMDKVNSMNERFQKSLSGKVPKLQEVDIGLKSGDPISLKFTGEGKVGGVGYTTFIRAYDAGFQGGPRALVIYYRGSRSVPVSEIYDAQGVNQVFTAPTATTTEVTPEVTPAVTTPEAEAQQKKDEKEAKKLENESRASLARLIAGERGNPVFGNVTMDDGIEALRQLDEAGDLPNIFFTEITTTQEFLSKPENEQNFPDTWAALSAGGKAEGMEEKGTAFVFIDNVGVTNLDRKLATQFGTTPEVAAVRRVAVHESIHKAISFLNESEQIALFRYMRELYSPEQLDVLAETYTNLENWRENMGNYLRLLEESLTRSIESMDSLPKQGVWGEFMQWVKRIWRKITGKKGEPTLNDLKDVMRLIRNGLRNSTKARADRTISGGVVRYSAVAPQAPATDAEYLAAVEQGDSGNDNLNQLLRDASPDERQAVVDSWIKRNPKAAARIQRMVDEAAKAAGFSIKAYHGTKSDFTVFDPKLGGKNFKGRKSPDKGWIFFSDLPLIAKQVAEQVGRKGLSLIPKTDTRPVKVLSVYINPKNAMLLDVGSKEPMDQWDQGGFTAHLANVKGHDSVIIRGESYTDTTGLRPYQKDRSTFLAVKNPNQIKSADPVTYDDAGNVIPPSQRFQPTSPDIRFSLPTLVSESASAFSSGQQAARAISFTPRQLDVYMAVLGAFSTLRRKGKQSATMQELFDAANTLVSGITPNEFSETLQGLYNDNAALLNLGDSTFQVFNRDGELAGAVVLMAKDASRASLIPPSDAPEIASKLNEQVRASVETDKVAKYTGRKIIGTTAEDHMPLNSKKAEDAATSFFTNMVNARMKSAGVTRTQAIMDVADTAMSDSFSSRYLADLPAQAQLVAHQFILAEAVNNIKNELIKLRKRNAPALVKRMEAKEQETTNFWNGLGTFGGTILGIRAHIIDNKRYGWMFAEKEVKDKMQKRAEDAVTAQIGNPGTVIGDIQRDADETASEAGDATAKEFEAQFEEDAEMALLREGEAELDGKRRTTWERIKLLIRRRAMYARRKTIKAASAARASLSKAEIDELNAILLMSDEEAAEAEAKDLAELDALMAEFLGEDKPTDTSAEKAKKGKRKGMVKAAEKIIFREGKDVEFRKTSAQEAVADLFNGADEYGKIVEEVGNALLSRVKQAKGMGGGQTAIKQLVESIKKNLLGNLPTPKPAPPTNATLGKMLAMTFSQQIREARLYADAWSKGRTEVRNLLAETGLEGEALENELDAIMPPTPALAYAPNAAKRAIALAMEQAGVTREELTDGRVNASDAAKAKVMAAFDAAAAAANISAEGWSTQGATGRQLAERSLNEAVQQWDAQDRRRLALARIVAEQSENPVALVDFTEKVAPYNLKPAEVLKLFDRARSMADRRIEIAEQTASNLIYRTEEQFRQGSKDLDESADKDSINKAFRDQVSEPLTLDEFIQRLAELNVGEKVATNLFRTAARERIDRRQMAFYDLLQGPRAAGRIFDQIMRMRRGIEMPLQTPIPWAQLLGQKTSVVSEYRQRVLDMLKSNPSFQDATDEQRQRLADLFTSVWQDQYAKIFANKRAKLERSLLARDKEKGANALRDARNEILESINLGVFNDDALVALLAEKFGVKSSFTEAERKRIEALGEELQDETINKAIRNRKARELITLFTEATDIPASEIASIWWVASVLSGMNTVFSIGAAFTNGAYEILGLAGIRSIDKLIHGDFKGAINELTASVVAMGRYLKAFPSSFNRAWQYLWSGDVAFLEAVANDPLSRMKSFADLDRVQSVADILAKDPNAVKRFIGLYTRFMGRLLTALDAFNIMVTKRGAISIALRQSELSMEQITDLEQKVSMDAYRKQIVSTDPMFKGEMPKAGSKQMALLNSMAEAIMYENLAKFGANMENADYIGSQAAMTLQPTGAGGFIYNTLMGITEKSTKAADEFLRKAKLQVSTAEKGKRDYLDLVVGYIWQFAAYQSANILGYRFARFAGNKFNQGISFLPFIGLLRLYERGNKNLIGKEQAFMDSIYRNQMIGFAMMVVGYLVVKAIAEEPDDEKRGWSWNGNWSNLTPEQIKQKLSTGEKQFTIRIGNKVFNYQNWPMNQMFAAIGSMSDLVRYSPDQWDEKTIFDKALSATVAGIAATAEIPALTQAGELFGNTVASKDPTEQYLSRAQRIASSWVGGFSPRILKDLDFMAEPSMRKYETLWEKTASHIPIYRRYVGEEYYDILGKQIEKKVYPGSREFMTKPSEPEYRILGALNSRGIFLTPANAEYRMVGKGRNRRRLTQQEADAYSLETGKAYKTMILRYGPRALKMSPERARAFLSDKADEVRDRVLMKVYRGYRSRPSAQ